MTRTCIQPVDRPRRSRRRAGTVLIVTMFIVLTVAAMAIVFARSAVAEATASANLTAEAQARLIAEGAVQYVIGVLGNNPNTLITDEYLDSEAVECAGGWFWLIRPDPYAEEGLTYGLAEEAAKLNINTATRDMLILLPNMTDELASSIIDWRDADESMQNYGAENDYYMSLDPGYYCKNGPFESIEELLLVRGATLELVFGEDTNRNNILDENENDGDETLPYDDRDNELDRGLVDLLTVYTYEPEVTAEGGAMVDVNLGDPTNLRTLLEERLPGGDIDAIIARTLMSRPYRNLIDYMIRAEIAPEDFNLIWDGLTTLGGAPRLGLVNVNTAPEQVLAALPEMTEGDAALLVGMRQTVDPENQGFAWVTEALSEEQAIRIGDFITGRSYQYTVDVVAVSPNAQAFKRLRVVVDAATTPPRILHYADVTALGWPLDPELYASLRRGEPPPTPREIRNF